MKNLKSIIFSIWFTGMFLFANTVVAANITSLEILPIHHQKKFLLQFESNGQGKVAIKILNRHQQIIFSKKINSGQSFERRFNLTHLEKGNYILQIENELMIVEQPLKVNPIEIEVDVQSQKTFFKPYINWNNPTKQLDINWLNNSANDVELFLSGKQAGPVLKDKMVNKWRIHQRYNLSALPAGEYVLTLQLANQIYQKRILVE